MIGSYVCSPNSRGAEHSFDKKPVAAGISPGAIDAPVVFNFLADGSAADAPDPPARIIRHDNRPIRQFLDVNRTSNTVQEALSIARAAAAHTQPHDLVPDRGAAIPAPVFGNQRFALQLREHGTAIEVKPERRDMGLELIRGRVLWRWRSRRLEAAQSHSAAEIRKAIEGAWLQ